MTDKHPYKKPARAVQRSTGWSYTRSLEYVKGQWKFVESLRISERKRRLAEMALREKELTG